MESQCHVGKVSMIGNAEGRNTPALSNHKITYMVATLKNAGINIPVAVLQKTCVEICPSRKKTSPQPNTRLVLGLSIGIPLGVIMIIVLFLSVRSGCCCRRIVQEAPIPLATLRSQTSAS